MSQRERLDHILSLVRQHGYVTVKYLTQELQYSTATINRDLNLLQAQKLIQRNYGSAELTEPKGPPPLPFRYQKMKAAKRAIGEAAATFVNDGDRIFIDASTTAQYIAPYLVKKKDLTVISNNMALLTYLSEYSIHCICLGGDVVEPPSMLFGPTTVNNVRKYRVDKFFFSTTGISSTGKIYTNGLYYPLYLAMAENARQVFYVSDHKKIDIIADMYLSLQLDYIISDYSFPDETKQKMKTTCFICI